MNDEKLMRDTIMMIRRTEGIFKKYLDRKVSYTGVYPTQHRLLMELNLNPGMSQIGLAEKFGVSAAAIAVSLKKLEKGGYILRLMDKEDNRVNQVSITEKGKEVIHKSIRIFQETDQAFFEGFQEEEIRQLLGYMERVYANMEALNQKAEGEKGK